MKKCLSESVVRLTFTIQRKYGSNMRNKDTNLWLSDEELQLLENTAFFESKRKLTEHLIEILSVTRESYRSSLVPFQLKLPENSLSRPGKISKGENYLGLPYLVLDFPASFENWAHSVFAPWRGGDIHFPLHFTYQALN